eukprot:m.372558 g.372558  ORF g.372558 m.372558 type:complete len:60 (-) comp63546_c0_seq1:25-204(-)
MCPPTPHTIIRIVYFDLIFQTKPSTPRQKPCIVNFSMCEGGPHAHAYRWLQLTPLFWRF